MQHSFFLPQHRVKQDLQAGMNIHTWFVPTEVGEFEIACAELCGLGHYRMRGYYQSHTQESYDAWMAEQVADQLGVPEESPQPASQDDQESES